MRSGASQSQYYGNVLMELHSTEGRPQHIKLLANVYSDANFEPALPFMELANVLFAD